MVLANNAFLTHRYPKASAPATVWARKKRCSSGPNVWHRDIQAWMCAISLTRGVMVWRSTRYFIAIDPTRSTGRMCVQCALYTRVHSANTGVCAWAQCARTSRQRVHRCRTRVRRHSAARCRGCWCGTTRREIDHYIRVVTVRCTAQSTRIWKGMCTGLLFTARLFVPYLHSAISCREFNVLLSTHKFSRMITLSEHILRCVSTHIHVCSSSSSRLLYARTRATKMCTHIKTTLYCARHIPVWWASWSVQWMVDGVSR